MVICNSGETLLQEATGIRRGWVYPVAKNWVGRPMTWFTLIRLESDVTRKSRYIGIGGVNWSWNYVTVV